MKTDYFPNKKGSVTIEVMMILPVVFAIFLLSIDFLFITYNRARAIAEVETVRINLCEQLAQATDESIISGSSDLITGNVALNIQSERGFLDAFHMWLSPENVSAIFKSGVDAQEVEFEIESVSSKYKLHLLSPSYIVDYTINVKSPFQKITDRMFASYRRIEGTVELPVNSHIQKMNTTEVLIDRLEKVDEIINLTTTIRSVIKKWIDRM